jgi:choline dehydrogenase-like flavoprotein
VIDPRYLTEDADVATLVAGVRIAQRMAGAPALKPWADAVYPASDAADDDLAAYIRSNIGTVFHPVGTVRMGAKNDPAAAVDSDLKVKGVVGLRVADASVFPSLIRGHTMAPAAFVGYRAGDLIARGA